MPVRKTALLKRFAAAVVKKVAYTAAMMVFVLERSRATFKRIKRV